MQIQHERSRRMTPSSDDFLYHLYRGSVMLLDDQVVEAKVELERALALRPQDAKSQDLLAGVYFRLGVYPQAIGIWSRLVDAYPEDPTLRVNLALALFKTGQADGALAQVHEALRIQPTHERAWGYLGLIQWRRGQLEEAREAFVRGGQSPMARRMEEARRAQEAGSQTVADVTDEELAAQDRAAMRSAAEEALERIEQEHLSLEPPRRRRRRPTGSWQLSEPGHEVVPHRGLQLPRRPLEAPPTLREHLGSWVLESNKDTPLAVGPTGTLFVNADRDVYLRFRGLSAVRGEMRTTAVSRRARGRDLDELLGEDEPIMHWRGPVAALIEPRKDETFSVMRLEGDTLYVRESALFGFDDRVGFESANLPLGGRTEVLTQLHGDGLVVLALQSKPRAIVVAEGEEVRVDPRCLLGWAGRLFPNAGGGTAPYAAAAPRLVFKGDGVVLLGER